MEGLKDKYFKNMFGFSDECKPKEECKDIYDILGFVIINVTKKNKKSFRVDKYGGLYKEVPSTWIKYSEGRLHREALRKIRSIIIGGHYNHLARKAFNLLCESDKALVCKSLETEAKRISKIAYDNKIQLFNSRLSEKEYSYDKATEIIEKYI